MAEGQGGGEIRGGKRAPRSRRITALCDHGRRAGLLCFRGQAVLGEIPLAGQLGIAVTGIDPATMRRGRGAKVNLGNNVPQNGVTTKRLNEQVRRNRTRSPPAFMSQPTKEEAAGLRSKKAPSKGGRGGRRYLPNVFTEHGAIMLASVLNTTRAVDVSVCVVRVCARLRQVAVANKEVAAKLAELERRVSGHEEAIRSVVTAIRRLMGSPPPPPRRRAIGFRVEEVRPAYRRRRLRSVSAR